MTPEKTYLGWRRTRSDVGCAFARMLAVDPGRYGQRILRVSGASADELTPKISDLVTQNLAAPEVVALTMVLPELRGSERPGRHRQWLSPAESGWTMQHWLEQQYVT